MRGISLTRCVVLALFASALACARNKEKETGGAAVQDTTMQNPPGYRGMETDTTMLPHAQQPVDTFLQQQGVNPRADTSGYEGMEHPDTSGMQRPDTAKVQQPDTTTGR